MPPLPLKERFPPIMACCGLCQYETNKLVRIQSVRLGSLKWSLNAVILLVICLMMLWNRKYQQFDLVVSSVTTKMKGVAQIQLPGEGQLVWDSVDYSGPAQKNSFFVMTNVIVTKGQKQGKCPEVPWNGRLCVSDKDCQKGASTPQSNGTRSADRCRSLPPDRRWKMHCGAKSICSVQWPLEQRL
uniref:Purinergic receptor P2X, ligand-gated ion channel, 7 n=1 Tax=Salarias fasciatus TaxID=181472 RepID=A0A672G3A5_SALFA